MEYDKEVAELSTLMRKVPQVSRGGRWSYPGVLGGSNCPRLQRKAESPPLRLLSRGQDSGLGSPGRGHPPVRKINRLGRGWHQHCQPQCGPKAFHPVVKESEQPRPTAARMEKETRTGEARPGAGWPREVGTGRHQRQSSA